MPTFLQEVPFITDARGNPTSAGDVVCIAAGKRLCPGNSFEEFCGMLKDSANHAELIKAFPQARLAVERENSAQKNKDILPTFVPLYEVSKSLNSGYLVYQKYGALTQPEFFRMFGKTPQQLGYDPVPLLDGSKYWLISLDLFFLPCCYNVGGCTSKHQVAVAVAKGSGVAGLVAASF